MQSSMHNHFTHRSRTAIFLLSILALAMLFPPPAAAETGGDIFKGLQATLDTIVEALTGTVGTALAILAMVAGGLLWMLADSGSGMRKVAAAFVGAAVVIGAAKIVALMGFTGAVLPGAGIA